MSDIFSTQEIERQLDQAAQLNQLSAPLCDAPQIEKLSQYLNILFRWTERVDLVSPAPREVLFERHIVDCLLAGKLMARALDLPEHRAVLDVGSGAGLPGVILAILEPSRKTVLCEPREKRTLFLKEVKRELVLENVSIARRRIEDVDSMVAPDLGLTVTRALGMEEAFLRESWRLLEKGGYSVLLTGPNWREKSSYEGAKSAVRRIEYELPSGAKHQLIFWQW